MIIVKATEDFVLNGMPYPDFPIVADDDMEIIKPIFEFLQYECLQRGRVKSKHSWWVYGQAMYDYFGFLEARNMLWKEISFDGVHSIVAAYRDWSINNLKLEHSTVNQRLRIIIRFYQRAYERGWIDNLPYDIESVIINKPKGFLAHTDRSGNVKKTHDVLLAEKKNVIKVLTYSQVKELLLKANNPTLNNIIRLGLQSGLRKEELLTFPKKYVQDPSRLTQHKSMIRVDCSRGDMKLKGDHNRGIDIPRLLMERLWHYVLHERYHRVLDGGGKDPETLFVTAQGKPWSVKSKALNNALIDLKLPFAVWPHLFRHTYATQTLYHLRKKMSAVDPLMYVKDRLGHSSVLTTMKYLHFLDLLDDEVITEYQFEIDAI